MKTIYLPIALSSLLLLGCSQSSITEDLCSCTYKETKENLLDPEVEIVVTYGNQVDIDCSEADQYSLTTLDGTYKTTVELECE